MNKKHWYCFAFSGKTLENNYDCQASSYTGYTTTNITLARIKENKVYAGVTESAVVLGITYLGYMTKEEFLSE